MQGRRTARIAPTDPRLLAERRQRGSFSCSIFRPQALMVCAGLLLVMQAISNVRGISSRREIAEMASPVPVPVPVPPAPSASPAPPPSSLEMAGVESAVDSETLASSPQPPPPASTSPAPPPHPSKPCLLRPLGYWTYEVCIGDEVRQFHSFVRGVDRREVTSLGKIDGAASTTAGAQQRYVGGGICEAHDKQKRETTITIGCGGSDRVTDVREPTPCHYQMSIELRAACVPPSSPAAAEAEVAPLQ